MTPTETVAEAHRRYRGAVERAASRILRDREDASDIASEAFLAMLERGPRDRQAALAWLLTTARRRALNVIRDRQRAARRAPAPPGDDADPRVTDERLTRLVAAAMARLSERDQAAVLLRFVQDCSPGEIAGTLGISVPASRVVVHRAVKRLRVETVRLLCEHHRVEQSCATRLAKLASAGIPTGHQDCSPCASVADEITALAAHSLIPVAAAPLIDSVASRARDAIASVKPRWTGAESHAAEAVAALIIATGLVAPSPSAATTGPAFPRVTAPVIDDRTAGAMRSPNATGPLALAQPAAAAKGVAVRDADGDAHELVGPPPHVEVLGTTVRLPDALDRSARGGNDIRSFVTYTEATSGGEVLVFLIGLAGPAAKDSIFTVSWSFDATACTGTATTQTASTAAPEPSQSLSASCPSEQIIRIGDETEPTSWYEPLVPHLRGDVIEIRIPLGDLRDGLAELLRPGRTLTALVATSNEFAGVVSTQVDQAPDEGGIRYTIGGR